MASIPKPPPIGRRIQELRTKRGLSVSELAQASGVGEELLRAVEEERANPTVAFLWKLARGLNMPLERIFNPEVAEEAPLSLIKKENAPHLIDREGKWTIQIVSTMDMVEDLELYLVSLSPRAALRSDPHTAGTKEIATVLRGEVAIESAESRFTLREGDTLHYAADVPHAIENLKDEPAELYLVDWFRPKGA